MAVGIPRTARILALAREQGVLRPRDLERLGLSGPRLSVLCRKGLLVRTGRGLYALADGDWTEHHSLVEVTRRVPACVIGLLSALRFHGLTTEMPHQVWVFVDRKARRPKVDYPSIAIFRCDAARLGESVERHRIEGTEVPITTITRTVADCFKHRRAVGLDVAVAALKDAIQSRQCSPAELADAAQKARVWNLMRPYLEALQ